MKIHFVTWATGEPYETTQRLLCDSLPNHTKYEVVKHVFNENTIRTQSWYSRISHLFEYKKHFKRDPYFFACKVFCPWHVMQEAAEGDLIYYADSSRYFKKGFETNMDAYFELANEKGSIFGAFSYDIRNGTTGSADRFDFWKEVGMEEKFSEVLEAWHPCMSSFIFKKDYFNINFMNQMCDLVEKRFPSGEPLIATHHSGDQPLYCSLILKYNLNIINAGNTEHNNLKSVNYIASLVNSGEAKLEQLIDKQPNFGFIFNRRAVCQITGMYWVECYKCIRKFWPRAQILIIDSFSDPIWIAEIPLTNCTIIKSEFDGAAWFASYYYFHKLRPFPKAVILHDSVFIGQRLDFESVNDIKYLWHFPSDHWTIENSTSNFMFKFLKHSEELESFYETREKWHALFGGPCIITFDFLDRVVQKYDLFNLLKCTKNWIHRAFLERVLAVVFTSIEPSLAKNPSLLGEMNYGTYIKIGITFNEYLNHFKYSNEPAIKVWTNRP